MRQQHTTRTYSELVCVMPGKGLTTLYRGNSYGQALAYRCNNALRTFKGSKVSAVERRSDAKEQTGWIYRDEANKEVRTLW